MRAFPQATNQTPMYSWLEAKYLRHIQNKQGFNGATYLKVEIMSDATLKLQYNKLTVRRTDVYDKILLLLQQLEVIGSHACSNWEKHQSN